MRVADPAAGGRLRSRSAGDAIGRGYAQDKGRPSFELTEIAGYPALVSRSNAALPICDIDIKPAERQSVSVTYESKEFSNNPQQAGMRGRQAGGRRGGDESAADELSSTQQPSLPQWVAQGCAIGIQPFWWDELGDVFADADFPLRMVDQVMMPSAQQHQI